MKDNSNNWISLNEALYRTTRGSSAPSEHDRTRLCGWIANGRVEIRAAELVTVLPPELLDAISQKADKKRLEQLAKAARSYSEFDLRQTTERDVVLIPDWLPDDAFHQDSPIWTENELTIPHPLLHPKARHVIFGLEASEADIERCRRLLPTDGQRNTNAPSTDRFQQVSGQAGTRSGNQATAGAENECRKWLLEEFKGDPKKKLTKRVFLDKALKLFGGRLSERGFLRVWRDVAPDEGRSHAGRKS